MPVYECVVNDVAVMRRKADGWLNATQILKVVGLDKPQRTRVLERDVQKSTHEKVQGGYGKYQGERVSAAFKDARFDARIHQERGSHSSRPSSLRSHTTFTTSLTR